LRTSLEHREPDCIPLDFGSTNVTGIHVSCVAALRDYYGLAPGPVKVYEPFQMLGWIDDDLHAAMGLAGVYCETTEQAGKLALAEVLHLRRLVAARRLHQL
jgi:hypothetical protein